MILLIIGLLCGFTSSVLGAGGGVIMIPAVYFFTDYTFKQVSVLSIGCMIPALILALYRHPDRMSLEYSTFMLLTLGALGGAAVGSSLVPYFSSQILSRVFGVLLLFVAVKCIFFPKDPRIELMEKKEETKSKLSTSEI